MKKIFEEGTSDISPVYNKKTGHIHKKGNRFQTYYSKTPVTNQHVLRSDAELQTIIDSKPKNWTKKDFRGEGKLNSKKILTRKETDRPGLIFYQKGKRINMKNILNYSTEESIKEFKKGDIDLETLKNRSSTIKWRSNMTDEERELYDKKIYANLTEKQLEDKRERQKNYYNKIK